MQVILLEKISNLGELGDKVDVKAGFGRNYLIPHHKAVSATAENVLAFEARRVELQGIADEKLGVAQKRATEIEALSITRRCARNHLQLHETYLAWSITKSLQLNLAL